MRGIFKRFDRNEETGFIESDGMTYKFDLLHMKARWLFKGDSVEFEVEDGQAVNVRKAFHMRGVVKRFEHYGFIAGTDGNDYFFTADDAVKTGYKPLYRGADVFFIPETKDGKLVARHVTHV